MTKAGHAMANGVRDLYVAEDWRAELSGSTRSVERACYPCADLTCLLCGGPQLGLEVLDLNAKGLLKILRTQKPLHEVSVGCNLPLNVFLEGAWRQRPLSCDWARELQYRYRKTLFGIDVLQFDPRSAWF